jgi:Matrixin/Bacterial Ig-like domain
MSLLRRSLRWERKPRPVRRQNKCCPVLEGLESRVVLYSASGNLWPSPQLITISFMPDGTNLGGGKTSNLQSTFNGKSSLGNWENVILQAAQTWAQQTNINFAVVPDDGAAAGSGADEEGNPGFGDIRIGGYNFGSSTLALTYQPPSANNFSIAGNITFNTGQSFNVGSTYDLFTVAMHEFGHALGLNESSVSNAVEYGTYTGKKTGLASDDIEGIQSIYSANGPRTADAYNTNGSSNGTLSTAASISSLINTSTLTALVPNLDISTAGQLEYFSFTAPAGTGSTLALDVQSSGLSLLSPKVTVYSANGSTVLASASGEGEYGTTLTVNLSSVTTGEKFTVEVQGADTTQMGTGNYALGLNFKGAAPPMKASPIVAEPAGTPEHAGDGQADGSSWIGYGVGSPVIAGISPDNGVSSEDGITNTGAISLNGSAPSNDIITLYNNGTEIGQTVALPNDTWTYNNTATTLSAGAYTFTAMATDPSGNLTPLSAPYQVIIDTHVPNPPVLNDISPETGSSGAVEYTNVNTPTFSGSTEPFAVVDLYSNGSSTPFGATEADISGNWSFTVGQPGTVTYPGASSSILSTVLDPIVGVLDPIVGVLDPIVGVLDPIVGVLQIPTPPSALADGTYNVTATAMDVAGTTSASSSTLTVVIDTQPPPAPANIAISPKTGTSSTVTTAQNLTISGTAQAGSLISVTLDGVVLGGITAGSNGAWSYNNTAMTLADGTYAITAQAEDVAGNISPVSAPFNATIETVNSPDIAGVSLTTTHVGLLGFLGLGPTQQSLSIVGTAPANDNVQVYLDGTLLGTATANGQGGWSYSYTPSSSTVANGVYSFSAITMDASGNVSTPSPTFQLQVGGSTTASTPQYSSGTLSGQATAGSLVTIVDGNIVLGVVVANSSGNWQFTPTLSKGKHSIMAEATNSAGDTSLLSSALSVSV